jgi:hypothetical protein
MSRLEEQVEVIKKAFPRDPITKASICAWDRRPRRNEHALCTRCWMALPAAARALYMDLSTLEGRAKWILDHAPAASS